MTQTGDTNLFTNRTIVQIIVMVPKTELPTVVAAAATFEKYIMNLPYLFEIGQINIT